MSVKKLSSINRNLSLWFQKNARVLPWRSQPEPYFVWLSEIMLQQTQVATVIPYFDKFTKKFPTVGDLAQASLDEVYALWAGLGYYSRARNLHRGAMVLSQRIQDGKGFPSSRSEWLEIPGVGEYTAGAVCSIALNQAEPIVDGNVVRVLSRVLMISKIDAQKTEIWKWAKLLVQQKGVKPRILNQALMELGATVCKPKNPRCEECPIRSECDGKKFPEKYPPPKPKKEWKQVQEEKWVLLRERAGKKEIYLEQNGEEKNGKKWRQGLWDFPNAGTLTLEKTKVVSEFKTRYVVTNHKITRIHTWMWVSPKQKSHPSHSGKWFDLDQTPALPSPVAKVIKKINEGISG